MRSSFGKLILYMVIFAIVTTILMMLPDWMPDTISREGHRVVVLFWVLVGVSIFILSIVMGTVLYSIRHFRAAPGDEGDGSSTHGSHVLEFAWTVIPTLIVTAIAIGSYAVLHKNEARPAASKSMVVDVTGFSFGWNFSYPAAHLTAESNLVLPENKTILFDVTSRKNDVIHSFWVPEARLQISAVPGLITHVQWTPDKITGPKDQLNVVCAQLCGTGHNLMRAPLCIVSEAVFEYWTKHTSLACADLQNTKKMKDLVGA